MITRYAGLLLICALTACSAAPRAFVPNSTPASDSSATAPVISPDHGASALPGGWLPCGWPQNQEDGGGGGEGGDVAGLPENHEASCSVAISNNYGGGNMRRSDDGGWWPNGLHPADIADVYALPTHSPGMTVAIVDAFDDPVVEHDLNEYRAQFNLGACTTANGCFTKVNEAGKGGPLPKSNVAWSHEIALDTEMLSAACPHCKILLVEAKSASVNDLGKAVDRAVAMGARVVSNSYYAVEWHGEVAADKYYNHPGVAITVSAGDVASPGGGDDAKTLSKRSAPYYPASSPYVTSIGGTSLHGGPGQWQETPWGNSGSGCSRYEQRPSFQKQICSTRSSVDIAMVADPNTGVAAYVSQAVNNPWVVAGGTSVGAPLAAGAYALSGNPTGAAFSYAHRTAFNDILPAGIDRLTGLGSPNGVTGL